MVAATPRYDRAFYKGQSGGSYSSAKAIIPLIMALLHPRSVVDFGCGIGTWLANFMDAGIADICGLDGDYVPRDELLIPQDRFHATDLCRPASLHRSYDLAVSLEVAEHLPEASAIPFVGALTAAAPTILFSAAVPRQGGTGHVNEQWQEYWRRLFRENGYVAIDVIRPKIWGNPDVEWWYQQNALVYVRQDHLASLAGLPPVQDTVSIDIVHPRLYEQNAPANLSLTTLARALPSALQRAVAKRINSPAARWRARRELQREHREKTS